MKQIEASKLARGMGAALERVVAGESLEIVRYGRVVALLVPPTRKREPRTVQPDKLGVVQTPTQGAKPFLKPALTPADRQRSVDQILRDSRRGN